MCPWEVCVGVGVEVRANDPCVQGGRERVSHLQRHLFIVLVSPEIYCGGAEPSLRGSGKYDCNFTCHFSFRKPEEADLAEAVVMQIITKTIKVILL